MKTALLFLMLQVTGTITFTGTIINGSGPTTTTTEAPTASTVASTPILQYYQSYAGQNIMVETITYE